MSAKERPTPIARDQHQDQAPLLLRCSPSHNIPYLITITYTPKVSSSLSLHHSWHDMDGIHMPDAVRLLDCLTAIPVKFFASSASRSTVLSHTWGKNEATFQEMALAAWKELCLITSSAVAYNLFNGNQLHLEQTRWPLITPKYQRLSTQCSVV